ncbi:UNVERIFIED_CONTAM: hypothetical protein Sradi_2437000 [Sesamum radiatum]|uniref:Uncharacterized protein n=1 Tax=Sesamum radiatum TaxID=300843 RepID=A0AAW2SIQ9_SESRA
MAATTSSAAPRARPPSSCAKLDGLAMWFINGLTGAFFASLEQCSCIRISTHEVEFGDEANDLPLIFNDGNSRGGRGGNVRRRRVAKGKQARASCLAEDYY